MKKNCGETPNNEQALFACKKVGTSIQKERAMADNMEWINDFDQALGLAKESGKHVFLDFFSPG